MFPQYYMYSDVYVTCTRLHPHVIVLSVSKGCYKMCSVGSPAVWMSLVEQWHSYSVIKTLYWINWFILSKTKDSLKMVNTVSRKML